MEASGRREETTSVPATGSRFAPAMESRNSKPGVRVERAVWKSADDIDVVPRFPLFCGIASHTGGHRCSVLLTAAISWASPMAIAGWRDRKLFLHSHMTAVLDSYRNHGIGRRLAKLFQREDAVGPRHQSLVEWTFDPLVTKNAYFNFMEPRRCREAIPCPNAYGITTMPLAWVAADRPPRRGVAFALAPGPKCFDSAKTSWAIFKKGRAYHDPFQHRRV